jgi:hypothetical protein
MVPDQYPLFVNALRRQQFFLLIRYFLKVHTVYNNTSFFKDENS